MASISVRSSSRSRLGDVLEVHPAVDALDDVHLVARLGGDGLHDEVVRTEDFVLLHVAGDEVQEGLAVLAGLAFADALAAAEFLEGEGIEDGHVLQGGVCEQDPGLEAPLARLVLAEVLEHGKEGLVSATATADCSGVFFIIVLTFGECAVLYQHEFLWMHIELKSGVCH